MLRAGPATRSRAGPSRAVAPARGRVWRRTPHGRLWRILASSCVCRAGGGRVGPSRAEGWESSLGHVRHHAGGVWPGPRPGRPTGSPLLAPSPSVGSRRGCVASRGGAEGRRRRLRAAHRGGGAREGGAGRGGWHRVGDMAHGESGLLRGPPRADLRRRWVRRRCSHCSLGRQSRDSAHSVSPRPSYPPAAIGRGGGSCVARPRTGRRMTRIGREPLAIGRERVGRCRRRYRRYAGSDRLLLLLCCSPEAGAPSVATRPRRLPPANVVEGRWGEGSGQIYHDAAAQHHKAGAASGSAASAGPPAPVPRPDPLNTVRE